MYPALVMPALVMRDLDPDTDQLVCYFNWQVHLLVSMFIDPGKKINRDLSLFSICVKEANLAYSPWNNGTESKIVVFSGSLNMPILKFDIFFQKNWRHFFFAFFYIVIFFNHLTKNKYISINSARWTLGAYYHDNQHIKDFFYLNKIKINDGSSEVSVF